MNEITNIHNFSVYSRLWIHVENELTDRFIRLKSILLFLQTIRIIKKKQRKSKHTYTYTRKSKMKRIARKKEKNIPLAVTLHCHDFMLVLRLFSKREKTLKTKSFQVIVDTVFIMKIQFCLLISLPWSQSQSPLQNDHQNVQNTKWEFNKPLNAYSQKQMANEHHFWDNKWNLLLQY